MPGPTIDLVAMARSYRSDGPLLVRPTFARAMVLAPHPDDEVIGCGGTVRILCEGGCQVAVTIATDGSGLVLPDVEPEEVGSRRRAEGRAACAALGALEPTYLGFQDGSLAAAGTALSDALSTAIHAFRPEAVFVPWLLDGHGDHRALAVGLSLADVPPETEVWCYEVWSGLPANRVVDVTGVSHTKRRALDEHRTPASVGDTSAHLGLQRWRSAAVLQGRGEVEGFMVMPFHQFSASPGRTATAATTP